MWRFKEILKSRTSTTREEIYVLLENVENGVVEQDVLYLYGQFRVSTVERGIESLIKGRWIIEENIKLREINLKNRIIREAFDTIKSETGFDAKLVDKKNNIIDYSYTSTEHKFLDESLYDAPLPIRKSIGSIVTDPRKVKLSDTDIEKIKSKLISE